MHEVEVVDSCRERALRTDAERTRLAEGSLEELQHFDGVGPGLDLPVGREATGIEVVEDVEAWQLVQGDARVEDRIGLTGVHLDVVTEVDERLGQVSRVDALTTDMGLPAIGQIGDTQRPVGVKRGPHKGFSLPVDIPRRSG